MIPKGMMTKLGAAGIVLASLGAAMNDFASSTLSVEKAMGYFAAISAALAALGIRRAIGGE